MGLFNTAEIAAMSGGVRPPAPKNYRLPEKFPNFQNAKRIAFDIEGKDPSLADDHGPGWRRDAFMCGFSLAIADADGRPEFVEYYPTRHKGGPNLNEAAVLEWLAENLCFFQGEIVGANLLYDFDAINNFYNIVSPLAKFRDVQFAEALIDENAFNYMLQRLGIKYTKRGKETDELEGLYGKGYKERMDEIHPGHMRTYGAQDVILPLEILSAQTRELENQKLSAVYDIESRLIPMLLYMRRKGQPVDLKEAAALNTKFTKGRYEALQNANKAIGKRGFEFTVDNFGKPSVLKAALDAIGVTNYPKTPKEGRPSITDEWLDALEHPLGKCLAAANRYDKALETFVNGYVSEYAIDGRVHCEFHPLRSVNGKGKSNGTVAGRFSAVHPNLQNIPTRDTEIGPLCRGMFIPEVGMDFFSGDYKQIEYKEIVHAAVVRAQVPREKATKLWGKKNGLEIWEKLQSAFTTRDAFINDPKTDFHDMMAKLTGLERKYAKSVNFAVAFVMGLQSFAETLGWIGEDGKPLQKAIDTLATYHNRVPFVKAVGQAMTYEAQECGYTTSLLGRRAHYDLWEPRYREDGVFSKALPEKEAKEAYGDKIRRAMTHAALNRYTQMGGADMMKTAMVQIWESGILDNSDDLIVSLTVHDELDGSVAPTPAGREKLREVQNIMENAIKISVPTTTDFNVGKNWADTH